MAAQAYGLVWEVLTNNVAYPARATPDSHTERDKLLLYYRDEDETTWDSIKITFMSNF